MKVVRHYLYRTSEIFKRIYSDDDPKRIITEILPHKALVVLNSRQKLAFSGSRIFMYNELNSKGQIKKTHIFYKLDSPNSVFYLVEDGIINRKTFITIGSTYNR